MARARMQPRTVRCGPEWDAALAAAEARGENWPDVLRAFVRRYARAAPARPDATTGGAGATAQIEDFAPRTRTPSS